MQLHILRSINGFNHDDFDVARTKSKPQSIVSLSTYYHSIRKGSDSLIFGTNCRFYDESDTLIHSVCLQLNSKTESY